MLIDALTVAAQIVNFLILVWLLKKFLFGRILRAIDEREQRIAAQLAETADREQQASRRLDEYTGRLEAIGEEKKRLLDEARNEASALHAAMLEKAREDVQSMETQWREELDREKHALLEDFRQRIAAEVIALTRRTIADLTSRDLQECAVRAFIEQMPTAGKDVLRNMAQGELVVRAALELTALEKDQITLAVRDAVQAPVQISFEHAPSLGLGLELCGNGWRTGWNSESYIEVLNADLLAALEHQEQQHPAKAGAA